MAIKVTPLKLDDYRRRVIMSLQGRQKEGKSHFSLTASKDLFYMNFDKISDEDVMPKFQGQMILPRDYWPESLTKEAGAKTWKVLDADFHDALSTDSIRTIVLDTFTELRNLALLSEYGKMTQLGNQFMYAGPHQKLRQLINDTYSTDKNVILIHKERKEYRNDSWTGDYEMMGFSETPFLVQANVRMSRRQDKDTGQQVFKCAVMDNSLNPDVIGVELEGEACNFPTLMTVIFPETSIEDWV